MAKEPKFKWVVVSIMGLAIVLSTQIIDFLSKRGLSFLQANYLLLGLLIALSVFYREIAIKLASYSG